MIYGRRLVSTTVWILVLGAVLSAQIPVSGLVTDETGLPLAGVELRLLQADRTAISQTVTGDGGRFAFPGAESGAYRMVVEKSGYFVLEREIDLKSPIVADVILSRKPTLEDSVVIGARPDNVELKDSRPSVRETLTNEQLDLLPAGNSRNFVNALPLSSSIVRDREGKLHIRGAGSESIQYQVDGIDITDPVNGNLRNVISTEAIESVDVVASGYAPEYGRSSGGLIRVETAVIPDKWRWSATDVVPNYSFRNRAIAEFAPRITAQGPVGRTGLSLMYALSGEYRNLFNEDLPRGENAEHVLVTDHLVKARYVRSDFHVATATVLFNRRRLTDHGLTVQNPVETATDIASQDYTVGLRDRLFLDSETLFESTIQLSVIDEEELAKGTESFRIWPNRRRGSYYIDETRSSRRFQWTEAFAWSSRIGRLVHKLKAGMDLASGVYHPNFSFRPVEFYRRDGTLSRKTWYDAATFAPRSIQEAGFFLQDAMTIGDLTITYGFRTDWDTVARDYNVAPRLGIAWYPGASRHTRISAGVGDFHDRLLLTSLVQEQFPRRTDAVFSNDGSLIEATYMVRNVPPRNLRTPLSRSWQVGIERELAPDWILRASFLKRTGLRELQQIDIAPPVMRNREVWLAVTNAGLSDYKSLDISTEKSWSDIRLSLSYSRSRSLQSLRIDPFALNIRQNLYDVAPSDWDTPHRFTAWTLFPFLMKSRTGIVVETRSGFPFSVRDDFSSIAGNRNSYRFPAHFTLGISFEREFPFTRKHRLGVRLSGFNLTNHFNPTFVDSNLTSPTFLQFGNAPRLSGNIRLRLIKRQ